MTSRELARYLFPVAVVLFVLGAVGLVAGKSPFTTWYYCFAWWPYILAAEAWLHKTGRPSLLFETPRRFLIMALLSIPLWLVFEVYNFRLNNWEYVGVPASLPLRWLGYSLSFATVLPGLDVTRRLLDASGLFAGMRTTPFDARRWYRPLVLLGAVCLTLPVVWPRYFFPLVWGGFLFLPEPWLHARGADSLLGDLAEGRPGRFLRILIAGAICGGLWESWNFWATAKWQYTVPFVGNLKVFEMPVAGYLGFPPFALECVSMLGAVYLFDQRVTRGRAWIRAGLALLVAVGCLATFYGIDVETVVSFL